MAVVELNRLLVKLLVSKTITFDTIIDNKIVKLLNCKWSKKEIEKELLKIEEDSIDDLYYYEIRDIPEDFRYE